MKLLTKTTLYIATLSLFLFFFMGIIFFQVLKNMSLSDLNRELYGIKEVVDDVFPHFLGGQLKGLPGVDSISIRAAWPGMVSEDQFGDTLMFDSQSGQFRTFRYLQFEAEHGGAKYAVALYKSTTPADKLVEADALEQHLAQLLSRAGGHLHPMGQVGARLVLQEDAAVRLGNDAGVEDHDAPIVVATSNQAAKTLF